MASAVSYDLPLLFSSFKAWILYLEKWEILVNKRGILELLPDEPYSPMAHVGWSIAVPTLSDFYSLTLSLVDHPRAFGRAGNGHNRTTEVRQQDYYDFIAIWSSRRDQLSALPESLATKGPLWVRIYPPSGF